MKRIALVLLLSISLLATALVDLATLSQASGLPCSDTPAYSNTTNIPAPAQFQTGLTFADFNHDGHKDALFSNENNETISLRIGDGSGGFSGSTDMSGTGHPWGLAAADFDQDGNMDFVATSPPFGVVHVRFGDGAGGFTPLTQYPVAGPWNDFVSTADFNGDGKVDIISPSYGASTVSVLLNNGSGSFTTTNIGVGTSSLGVDVGDLNGDGNADFVTANYDNAGTISVRLGNGAGGFAAMPDLISGSFTWGVGIGNFNGDAFPDLASTNRGSNSVTIFLGDGTGNFALSSTTPTTPHPMGIAVEDLDNNGVDDVIAVPQDSNELRVFLGDGAGGLSLIASLYVDYNSFVVAVSDLNDDGILDFGIGNNGGFQNQIRIFMGDCEQQPAYQVEVLYDETKAHKAGSTVPIKIKVLDAEGNNVSSPSLVVHAVDVIQTSSQASTVLDDAGNANPDFDFRYDANLGGYVFNLKTTGYTTGSYRLNFVIGGGTEVYSVGFQVRQ